MTFTLDIDLKLSTNPTVHGSELAC